jgi:hypothetical protein
VAEQSSGPAGQDGGKASSLLSKACVSDCVDTMVETMQASGREGPGDAVSGIAERAGQLTDRDDAVLAPGQRCEVFLRPSSSFVPHSDTKGDGGRISPPYDAGSEATKRSKAAMSVTGGPWPGRISEGLRSASLRIERRFSAGS